jgi:hypothetical protein
MYTRMLRHEFPTTSVRNSRKSRDIEPSVGDAAHPTHPTLWEMMQRAYQMVDKR